MSATDTSTDVEWEFSGAFSIVFNGKETKATTSITAHLKEQGFSIHSIRHSEDIASCGNVTIQGIKNNPAYADGVRMKDLRSYFSYNFIERIVTADGQVLWSR